MSVAHEYLTHPTNNKGIHLSESGLALVTGASGFVGGQLAKRLLHEGYRVKLLLRRPEAASAFLLSRCEVIQGDLNNQSAVAQAVKDCDFVFHCAANASPWDSLKNYQDANVRGVHTLLRALSTTNYCLQRLVHVSTVDVYGYPDSPCTELSATRKVGFGYGDSKLDGELLLRSFADAHNIPYVILRPANIIGPGSQFIEQIDEALRTGKMLTIENGSANAGLVYIENLIDYMLWAAHSEAALNEVYNVRDDYDVSWLDFLTRLQTLTKCQSSVKNLPYRAAILAATMLEKLYRVTGRQHLEPPLHKLLVCMFGKTCGHSAEKIRAASGIHGAVDFDNAMLASVSWLQQSRSIAT